MTPPDVRGMMFGREGWGEGSYVKVGIGYVRLNDEMSKEMDKATEVVSLLNDIFFKLLKICYYI